MLALKTLTVGDAEGKTLIFDEVDAGIGGRVADVVGSRLRALGDRFQVLCITHLPQIAARATTHFQIEKQVRGRRTVTSVALLDDAGRVEEIGRMIGGAAISEAARATARDLLDRSAGPLRPSTGSGRPERVEGRGTRPAYEAKGERRKRK
jgi:DNA repair protein RecN (Recombination protein N)